MSPGVLAGGTALAALTVLLYAGGHRAASGASGSAERTVRAAIVALNAAGNGAVLLWLGLPVAGAAVGLINLGAAVPILAGSRRYASLLACSSPAMPMSWPVMLTGALAFLASLLAAPFGRPFRLSFDGTTATLVVHGGVPYLRRCGYNLGNFVLVHPAIRDASGQCPPDLVAHETGHTLNLAAFGSVFHVVGAIHENWGPPPGGAHREAYAELLAESRRRAPGHPWLDAWPMSRST